MGIEYYLPHFSLCGLPFPISLRAAKRAGADGVEIHLVAKSMLEALRVAMHARAMGLGVHWHQGWSLEEDYAKLFLNKALDFFWQLPRSGYLLDGHIPPTDDPAVIYVERVGEIGPTNNWWVQTACNFEAHPDTALTFERFLKVAEELNLGIVFDVQHVLEWVLRKDIADLPQNSTFLWTTLEYAWSRLHTRVREIHFTDTDPRKGSSAGRNVFPGEGILPLADFCAMVRESRWNGVVVPEVRLSALLRYGVGGVLEKTREYFS
ncbi:MAG: hypothetical protein HYY10_04485 [Candidatus Liptonbacteria bacterium]|nr:hypothetical protein [Candidatus Liptonbacteria bacterium]